jgi:hypothetical protein
VPGKNNGEENWKESNKLPVPFRSLRSIIIIFENSFQGNDRQKMKIVKK